MSRSCPLPPDCSDPQDEPIGGWPDDDQQEDIDEAEDASNESAEAHRRDRGVDASHWGGME